MQYDDKKHKRRRADGEDEENRPGDGRLSAAIGTAICKRPSRRTAISSSPTTAIPGSEEKWTGAMTAGGA